MLDFGVESRGKFEVFAEGGVLFGDELDLELVEGVPHGIVNKNKISILVLAGL